MSDPHRVLARDVPAGADDPIFALNAEARRRAAAGESIVNATLGALVDDEGRLAVLPSVVEALREAPIERAAGYAPIAGEPNFLRLATLDALGDGPLVEGATAVATPGGSGALHLAISNFLAPGQHLLTSRHYWGPYETMASHAGRAVRTFETFDERLRFDAAGFGAALARSVDEQGRALVVLNFPCHNPTGYSLDDDEWRAVADAVRDAGRRAPVTVVIDLAYAAFGGARAQSWRAPVASMLDRAVVLVAWTASKAFTQYGARVGALIAVADDEATRERIASLLSVACRGTWSNCNHLGQLVVGELLADPAKRARIEEERAVLVDLLDARVAAFRQAAAARGVRHPRYEGGFFVAVPCADGARTAARMRDDGVFVVPIDGAVRIALCSTAVADVDRAVDSLAAARE
ncbi:MAG: pyridoxal phosphate-dependent aminotransferase [Planctomycetota bacterium JB042]